MSIVSLRPLCGNRNFLSSKFNRTIESSGLSISCYRPSQQPLLPISSPNLSRHNYSATAATPTTRYRRHITSPGKSNILSPFSQHHQSLLPEAMSKPKPKSKFEVREYSDHKAPAPASPSASII